MSRCCTRSSTAPWRNPIKCALTELSSSRLRKKLHCQLGFGGARLQSCRNGCKIIAGFSRRGLRWAVDLIFPALLFFFGGQSNSGHGQERTISAGCNLENPDYF
jgi:hypothetical protein